MSGQLATSEDGRLLYIPEELADYLALSDTDVEQAREEVVTYGGGVPGVPALDIRLLDKQWTRFKPTVRRAAGDGCGTDDSGAMGCPG